MKKICTKCNKNKSLEEFYFDSWHKHNRSYSCKECIKIARRKHYIKNKEKITEHNKKYYIKNKEKIIENSKKRNLVYGKEYREKNKERISEYNRDYSIKNKEKLLKKRKEYYKTEAGKLVGIRRNNNRRSREKNIINNLTIQEKNIILSLQNYKCISCDQYFDMVNPTLDHIIPVVSNGGLTKNNVQILCKPCNSKKFTQEIDYRSQIHKQIITNLNS
jgi:5-methylcytosine-specific restriction endonuclease McrA